MKNDGKSKEPGPIGFFLLIVGLFQVAVTAAEFEHAGTVSLTFAVIYIVCGIFLMGIAIGRET